MPKKKESSNKAKIIGIFIIVALIVSTLGIFLLGGGDQGKNIPLPSINGFVEEEWMLFVPADVYEFRYLNITKLSAYPGILYETVLSIPAPQITVNTSEISYGVDIRNPIGVVSILGVGEGTMIRVSSALESSNITPIYFNGTPIYVVPASNGSSNEYAWLALHNRSLFYCEGNESAYQALTSVLGSEGSLFDEDEYKQGYMLATGGNECFALTYYRSDTNAFNITWLVSAASGTTKIEKRDVFAFPSSEIAASKYSSVSENLVAEKTPLYQAEYFLLAKYTYQISELNYVLGTL